MTTKIEALPPSMFPEYYSDYAKSKITELGSGLTLRELNINLSKFEHSIADNEETFVFTLCVSHRDTGIPTLVKVSDTFTEGDNRSRAEFVRNMLINALSHEIDELLELDGKPVRAPHKNVGIVIG